MAYSYVSYTSTGGQNYNVPFPYLDADHVKVLINGVETSAFTWSDGATIHLDDAPAVGATITVKRETPRDGMDYSFSAQPRLKGEDLDEALLQTYYIGLEALDNASHDVLQAYVDGAAASQAAAELAETNAGLAQAAAGQARDAAVVAKGLAEYAADLAASYAGSAGAGTYMEVPTAPSTDANEVKMYAKDVTGVTELFIRKESDGAEIQVTSGSILNGTPPDASEGTKGIAELATQAETDAGTDDARIVTPKKLADYAEHRGMKNLLINGCMRVCQRGSQPLDAQKRYGLDRWNVFWNSAAGVTPGTQERLPYASTTYLETTSCMALAGLTCTGTNVIYVNQRIESANAKTFLHGVNHGKWSGQFKFWHDFGSSVNVYLVVYSANAADNFSAITVRYVSSAQSVPTSTFTSLKFEGIDIPTTDMYNGLQFTIKIETPVCSGNTIYIGDAQFEIGPKCTTFERRPYGLELALCQRYYEVSTGRVLLSSVTANDYMNFVWFRVSKRANPTCTIKAFSTNTAGCLRNLTASADVAVTISGSPDHMEITGSIPAAQLLGINSWVADIEL